MRFHAVVYTALLFFFDGPTFLVLLAACHAAAVEPRSPSASLPAERSLALKKVRAVLEDEIAQGDRFDSLTRDQVMWTILDDDLREVAPLLVRAARIEPRSMGGVISMADIDSVHNALLILSKWRTPEAVELNRAALRIPLLRAGAVMTLLELKDWEAMPRIEGLFAEAIHTQDELLAANTADFLVAAPTTPRAGGCADAVRSAEVFRDCKLREPCRRLVRSLAVLRERCAGEN